MFHDLRCHRLSRWQGSTQGASVQTWHLSHWFYCPPSLSFSPNNSSWECMDLHSFFCTQWFSPPELFSPTISSQTAAVLSKEQVAITWKFKPFMIVCLSFPSSPGRTLDGPNSPSILTHSAISSWNQNDTASLILSDNSLYFFLGPSRAEEIVFD